MTSRPKHNNRIAYYHVTLVQARIPHVANMDERHDIKGYVKIADTTAELENFHPSFTVVSSGGFNTLVVRGNAKILADLFRKGTVASEHKHRFPKNLITHAECMSAH